MSDALTCEESTLERVAHILGPQCEAARVIRLMATLRNEGKRPACFLRAGCYLVIHDMANDGAQP